MQVLRGIISTTDVPFSSYISHPRTPLHYVDARLKQLWLFAILLVIPRSPWQVCNSDSYFFARLIFIFLGYFDPINTNFDSKNKHFFGWHNQCFGSNKSTDTRSIGPFTAILPNKVNQIFLRYIDPINTTFYSGNKYFSGWRNRSHENTLAIYCASSKNAAISNDFENVSLFGLVLTWSCKVVNCCTTAKHSNNHVFSSVFWSKI